MQELRRMPSGIEGLDQILNGGFIEGASCIIQGRPGAGKTILSNQIAFAHAAAGAKVLYVTLLAENHDRLFQALSTLDFYDGARVGQDIIYLSVFQVLRDEGLSAIVKLLRNEIKRHSATLLVFDGLLSVRDRADSNLDVKAFVAEIQSQAAFVKCTVLFLTSARLDESSPEHTMVDSVIDLKDEIFGMRNTRQLQVRKSRGGAAFSGLHEFEITDKGINVYPRLEGAVEQTAVSQTLNGSRVSTGCAGVDALTKGGFPSASVTLLAGSGGTGKTTFGLHFLSRGGPEEPALHFGFYETPARIRLKAKALGIDLPPEPFFEIVWNPFGENILDKLGNQLLDRVRTRKVRRLFIDGLGGFERAATQPARLTAFLCSLANRLRALGVTTVLTWEQSEISNTAVGGRTEQVSAVVDNLILFKQSEQLYELKRSIAVQKMRDSDFLSTARKLEITDTGLNIGEPLSPRTRSSFAQQDPDTDQRHVS